MAFPGPYAEIIRNEEGEVLGWDNHYYDEPDFCDNCGGAHSTSICSFADYEDEDEDDG